MWRKRSFPEWADTDKDKFDDDWYAYQQRVFKRQLELGIIPSGTKLTPHAETLESWDSIPQE